jgi:hypothetical protein
MKRKIKRGYHVTCFDCNKYYCLASQSDQVWVSAGHDECGKVMSFGRSECDSMCLLSDEDK